MRLKWESGVARDIAIELKRLNQESGACAAVLGRMEQTLREMAKTDDDETIEKFIAIGQKLLKRVEKHGEALEKVGRGVERATELFEQTVQEDIRSIVSLDAHAAPIGGAHSFPMSASRVPEPLYNAQLHFRNLPGLVGSGGSEPLWPVFESIQHTVPVERISIQADIAAPPWFQGIIDREI